MNCNRKAGFQYICGYEDPGTDATDFGTEVHAELETIKKTPGYFPNRLTHVGAVASEALPFVEDFRLDAPAEERASCEGEFTFRGRHAWRGLIDLRKPGKINDYKTTSDFKWAKTHEELLLDPQAVLYATYEFSRWDGPTVELQWLYLHKKKNQAKPIVVTMTREHATRCFSAMEAIADEFQAAADGAPDAPDQRHRYVLDVLQPNYDHCDAYGGCPHKARCNPPFFASEKKGKGTVNLLEKLEAMDTLTPPANAPQAVPAAPPVASGAFAPGGAFAGTDAASLVAQATIEGTSDAPATEPAIPVGMVSGFNVTTEAAFATGVAAEPNAVNPPKRGRGRPKGSTNKPKDPPLAALAALDTGPGSLLGAAKEAALAALPAMGSSAPAPEPAPAAPPASTTAHRITTLYVGCVPHGADGETDVVVDFDLLVAKCKVAIGPATYYAKYGYVANGMLLQMMESVLQHEKPGALVVTYPSSPEATLCLSHLRSISDTVVEAVAR